MSVTISSLGLATQSIMEINNVQSQLSDLSTQLSTGKKSLDLADYSLNDSNSILNLNSLMTKKQSYVDSIKTVKPTMDVYNTALGSMNTLANNVSELINQATDPNQASSISLDTQVQGFLQQMGYYLNQQTSNGNYVFNGGRAGVPVQDLTALGSPSSTSPVSSPTLPDYDVQAPGSNAAAYTTNSVKIDDNYTITYGISSNNDAFQNIIGAMRWAKEAAAQSDPTTFNTDMNNARTMLAAGVPQLQALQAQAANNTSQMNSALDLHNTFITNARSQIDTIQSADPAQVATQISFAQSQLEASYSVTGKIASLSLVNFLP